MRRAILGAAGLAASVFMLANAAPAFAEYGAFARDEATGKYGFSWNEANQKQAEDAAIKNCNTTGYRGRMGIYEIMLLDDEMRDQIIKHASTQVLRAEAKKRGMRTLRQSGLINIYDGITTIEEVVRETIMEEG